MLGGQCTVLSPSNGSRARLPGHVRCAPSHISAHERGGWYAARHVDGARRARSASRASARGAPVGRRNVGDAGGRGRDARGAPARRARTRFAPLGGRNARALGSSRVVSSTRCPGRGTARLRARGRGISAARPPIGGPIQARSRTIRAILGVVQRFAAPRNGACPAPIAAEKYNLDAAIPVRSPVGSHVVWQLHHARAPGRQGVGAR